MSGPVTSDPAAAGFVCYGDHRVGVLDLDGRVRDVCGVAHAEVEPSPDHPTRCLPDAVLRWDDLAAQVVAVEPVAAERAVLRAPVPRPRNVFGAPVNYLEHAGELGAVRSPSKGTVRELGLFVKAAGSVSGPDEPIALPDLPGREFHYEGEIAVVIGRNGEDLDREGARRCILGFTGALDVTLRLEEQHREERSMRKSYRTFTPLGPSLVPFRDDAQLTGLGLRLSVGGDVRQEATLAELVMDVLDLVVLASSIVALEPGDVILTGTPGGVGPLVPGDVVEMQVTGAPAMQLDVVSR